METVGWIGAICFALCGLPQAIRSYKDGHSKGISWGFLSLWLIGEVCTLLYILPKRDLPLILNYVLNLLFLLIIIYFKVTPKAKYEKINA